MSEEYTVEVVHNAAMNRFEADLDGATVVVDYRLNGQTMTITHTGVPAAYEGRGIAAQLTKFALEYAREHGYQVQPLCSYTAAYIRRNRQYQDLSNGS